METRKTKMSVSAQGQEPQVFHAATSLPAPVATQWQFGDWKSLQAITLEQLEPQEGRAQLAGMVAVSHFQQAKPQLGKQYLAKAREWGCSRDPGKTHEKPLYGGPRSALPVGDNVVI